MDKMNRRTAEYRTAEYRRKVFYQFMWIEKDRAKRFLTSTFDIHVIDIRYSQFSTDCFANDDNLQYNLFGSGLSGLVFKASNAHEGLDDAASNAYDYLNNAGTCTHDDCNDAASDANSDVEVADYDNYN